jgi:hypothetical protein
MSVPIVLALRAYQDPAVFSRINRIQDPLFLPCEKRSMAQKFLATPLVA